MEPYPCCVFLLGGDGMPIKDQIQSTIRVLAGSIVATLAAFLAGRFGLEIGEEVSTTFVVLLTGVFTSLYYLAVRLLAIKWPFFELFLIVPKSPVMVHPARRTEAVKQVATLQTNNKTERF